MDKQAILARCAEHNSKTGWLYKLLEEILNTTYPKGTIIPLVFIDAIVKRGLRYKSLDWHMEDGSDCAEFWRSIDYIFFGKDIGNCSRAQAANTKMGTKMTDRTKMRELDMMYLDVSPDTTAVNHAMGCVSADGRLMVHTTQLKNTDFDLRYEDREYYMDKYGEKEFKWCMRFISDEELASVTVGGEIESEVKEMVIDNKSSKQIVYDLQVDLKALGADLGTFKNMNTGESDGMDGLFGTPKESYTSKAVMTLQAAAGIDQTGIVDALTARFISKMLNGGLVAKVNELQAKATARESWYKGFPA